MQEFDAAIGKLSSVVQNIASQSALSTTAVIANSVAVGLNTAALQANTAALLAMRGMAPGPQSAQLDTANKALAVQFGQLADQAKKLGGAQDQAHSTTLEWISTMYQGIASIQSLGSAAAVITPFVQAFSPSAVLLFEQAIYDTTAVLGSALTPVLHAASGMVRNFGDQILPLMQELQAPLAELSGALSSVANMFVNNLVAMVHPLVSAFAALTPIISGFTAISTVWQTLLGGVINTVVEGLKAMFGGDGIKTNVEFFRDAMQSLAKQAVLAAASLMKLTGHDNFVAGMIKALDSNKGTSFGTGAAKNAQIQDVMSFGRQLATNAAMASMAPDSGKTSQEAFRKDLLEALKEIQKGDRADFVKLVENLKGLMSSLGNLHLAMVDRWRDFMNHPLWVKTKDWMVGAERGAIQVANAGGPNAAPAALAAILIRQGLKLLE